jgi:hypothetical protein
LIARYVASKAGNGILYPKSEVSQLRAEELLLGISDIVEEGHRHWHAIDCSLSYED